MPPAKPRLDLQRRVATPTGAFAPSGRRTDGRFAGPAPPPMRTPGARNAVSPAAGGEYLVTGKLTQTRTAVVEETRHHRVTRRSRYPGCRLADILDISAVDGRIVQATEFLGAQLTYRDEEAPAWTRWPRRWRGSASSKGHCVWITTCRTVRNATSAFAIRGSARLSLQHQPEGHLRQARDSRGRLGASSSRSMPWCCSLDVARDVD